MLTQYRRPNTMKMEIMPGPNRMIKSFVEVLIKSLMATESRITISTSGKE